MSVPSQSGNVLFIILIAVALLAALSFAVSQSGRGNVESLSAEKARLYASEILEYSNTLANAVAQTRLRGFTVSQISFENDIVAGYANGNCSDDLCKIFHPNGGGVSWMSPASGVNDGSEWFLTGETCVNEVGTGTSACGGMTSAVNELIGFLPNVDLEVCIQLNRLLGVANPSGVPPQEGSNVYDVAGSKWTGAFSNVYAITGVFAGVPAACFEGGGTAPIPGTYHFYQVLIAR